MSLDNTLRHFEAVFHVMTRNGDLPFFALGFQFLEMFLFSFSAYFTVSIKMTLAFLQSITCPIFYVRIVLYFVRSQKFVESDCVCNFLFICKT